MHTFFSFCINNIFCIICPALSFQSVHNISMFLLVCIFKLYILGNIFAPCEFSYGAIYLRYFAPYEIFKFVLFGICLSIVRNSCSLYRLYFCPTCGLYITVMLEYSIVCYVVFIFCLAAGPIRTYSAESVQISLNVVSARSEDFGTVIL